MGVFQQHLSAQPYWAFPSPLDEVQTPPALGWSSIVMKNGPNQATRAKTRNRSAA